MTELHKIKKPSLRRQKNLLSNYLEKDRETNNFIHYLYQNNPTLLTNLYNNYIIYKETQNLELNNIQLQYNTQSVNRKRKIIRKRTTDKTPILLS
tara:strand:- start:119 stop:403 length:285 start_codon:yes stop_codon:yes gene_type:complete